MVVKKISLGGWKLSRISKAPSSSIESDAVILSSSAIVPSTSAVSPTTLDHAEEFSTRSSVVETVDPRCNGLFDLTKDVLIPEVYSKGTFPIDIIAVHGVNGGAFSTWTHDNGTFWLRDLLPKELPGARVYSFAYPAKLVFSRETGGIDEFARELLEAIRTQRNTEEVRYAAQ